MRYFRFAGWLAAALLWSVGARAQAPLPIYTDNLVNGFQDWSWASHNLANTTPVNSGSYSIAVTATTGQALSFYHSGFDTSPYASLTFWANGGSGGRQVLQIYVQVDGADQPAAPALAPLPNNAWQQFTIPLASLNAERRTNVTRFNIQLTSGGTANTFYVDDIQITAKAAPAVVNIGLEAGQAVRRADARWFGLNTAIWDQYVDGAETLSLLRELGTRVLRFPGGSISDTFHWRSNYVVGSSWQGWPTWFTNFAHVATNIGAQAIITANYGTGTAAEAADWVRFSNLTNRYGFEYWEVGNECYGSWEADAHVYPNDAFTYATNASTYILQMRAADPTIKVGVVAVPGEGSYANSYAYLHPVINPRTGQTNYGWTPILLSTLRQLGVTPDFLVHHRYPEYTDQESDALLLQTSSAWTGEAADLRQQLSDYLGSAGTNVELLCTENNSNAGAQGKQSVSLVNALYFADSLGQLMQTELNGLVWWDLRNGNDTSGNLDPTIYGWRMYGDLGMVGGATNRYPPFYAAKLMQHFARPGDTILAATSDYLLVSAYASRHTDGTISLLALNKDSVTSFSGQIHLGGFTIDSATTLTFYGIPQDNAARTGVGSPDIAQSSFGMVSSNFSYSLPALSLSLFTFTPQRLSVSPSLQTLLAGETTNYIVTVLPVSWLTNNVTLTVAGLPPGVSASFNPPILRGSGSSSLSVSTFGAVQPGFYPFTVIAAGDGLTNAATVTLMVSLGVVAWGNNDFGQGTMPAGLAGLASISSGGYHNLALRRDGTVFAWGSDVAGQCDVPAGLSNVVAVAGGSYHSLALREDGTIVAWGDNSAGQVEVPASATNIVAISAGGWHNLALRNDGTVLAWGDDGFGQSEPPAEATNLVAIAAGGQHSLVLRSDGLVIAWGSNGDPFGVYAGQAHVPDGLSDVIAVAAGGYHSLALKLDGTVASWGANWAGQAAVPQNLVNVVAVAAGQAHSLALRENGTLLGWGDDSSGQCQAGVGLTGVAAISAGNEHSLALIGVRPGSPSLAAPVVSANVLSVAVPTVRGRAYFLQYKDSLADPAWKPVSAISGNGGVRTLTDTAANGPQRFYRLRQE